MVVDGHAHVWPDRIAPRALEAPSSALKRFGDGTVAGLAAVMQRAGVDRSTCLAVADTPERVDAANRFVGGLDRSRFVAAGTIHPDLPVEENLDSLRANGVRAVKVHPLFQGFRLDEGRLWRVLDALQGELPVIVHVGQGGEGHGGGACTPAMLRDVVRRFPALDVIACHFGGYLQLEEAEEHVLGLPVFLDTSWPPGLSSLAPTRVRAIIERHGADRVVFASDWPMADPAEGIATIESLGLSAEDTEAILGGTLARLLRLDEA